MAAENVDAPGTAAVEKSMPTIDEKEALTIHQGTVSAKPSSGQVSQPGNAEQPLSNRTSASTLAPQAPAEGHAVSTRSSAATLVAGAHRLTSTKPSLATLSTPGPTQTATPAKGSPGREQIGKAILNLNPKTKFKHFLRIFAYSSSKDRLILLVAVLASICTGVTMPLMNIVFGRVFGSFTAYYHEGNTGQTTEDIFRREIIQCVFYLVYIFIARLILSYIAFFGFRVTSLRISAAIRLEYMKCLYGQPVSVLDSMPPGQTAAIITITASTLQFGISEKLSSFLQALSLITSALLISMLYNWKLALVTSSGLVLVIGVYAITTPMLVRVMNHVQSAEIKASTVANEIFSSIRMISAFGAEQKMMKRYESWVQESRRRGLKMPPIVACQQAPVFFSIYATFALCFWYSLRMYMAGQIDSPQTLIIVLLSVMLMASSIGNITTPLSAAARAAGAAAIFFATIDAPRPKPGGLKDPDVSAGQDIVLSHINFAFPSRPNVKILDDLSVCFPAGKTTALVGPSGSGKSTIVALVERWYELDGDMALRPRILWLRNGSISVGGQQLKHIDIKWWRSQIGLVQQEPALFNNSIYRNVEHGLVGTQWENAPLEIKAKMVKEACQEAFAEEFILRLPDKYDTMVGDAGIKLSGGQRQRLAIARAIVRRPKILILDEATSAIDVRGEQIVQAALDKVSENRTTIMIAHRLSTVQKADNIIVMRKGSVVEQGTHAELMAREGGAYWTLATAQQLAMAEDDDTHEDMSGFSEKNSDKKSTETTAVERGAVDGNGSSAPTSDASQERGLFGSFGMLLKEQKSQSPWYFLLLIGAIGGGASAPVQAFLFANLVSLFQLLGNSTFLQPLSNFWCLMFVMLAVGVGISYFILGWAATTVSFNITHHYRKEYLRNILSKAVSFFDEADHSVGAMTARLATDPTQLQQLLGMNMAFVIISVFNVIGCLTISFYFGWKLTLVTVCTTMPIILGAAFFRVRYERQFERMNNAVFAESAKYATESIGAFRTVSSFTLEDAICQRYEHLLQTHIRKTLVKSSFSTLLFALSDSISLPCMAFILWYGGKLMAEHEYWPFQYVIVYIAVLQGGIGAGQWLSFGPNIAKATVAANRIIALRRNDHADGRLISLDIGDISDDDKGVRIDFRDVWFRYPTRDAPVLNGLDMTIEKGQFAAVVGPSGSGKTTVISLLQRFYRPSSGTISYNGLDIQDLFLENYRREISLVAQEPCLFEGSIRENVLLGVLDDSSSPAATDAAVEQACRDAGIHDFIASLPDGYATGVGSRGIALSGGQKQRISIARALIRNPRLLLLDEATSNLDSHTEQAVQAVFERTRTTRTMVVVAHRLATIQNADVIFVLSDGRVVEKGDHAALLKKRGVYYQMCLSQALDK